MTKPLYRQLDDLQKEHNKLVRHHQYAKEDIINLKAEVKGYLDVIAGIYEVIDAQDAELAQARAALEEIRALAEYALNQRDLPAVSARRRFQNIVELAATAPGREKEQER